MGQLAIIAAAGMQAYGQYKAGQYAEAEGKSQQNVANYNALVQEREAEAARLKTRFEQRQQAKRAARIKGEQRAKIAAAGGLGAPVAEDLGVEQAKELELENLLIGYEGETEAKRAESQAYLDRLQGKIYGKRGKARREASYYKTGTTLLTGFEKSGYFD